MKRRQGLDLFIRSAMLLAVLFAGAAALIAWDGLHDEAVPADVAVVLGNEVMANGSPSERLKGRLNKTVELYHKGLFQNVVVSGGLGKSGYDEAVVMRSYLMHHDVPSAAILVDSGGINTYHTAKNCAQLMSEHHWRSVLVISQFFHISRSKLAMRRFGVSLVYSAHADYYELRDIFSLGREVVAYAYYFVRRYRG